MYGYWIFTLNISNDVICCHDLLLDTTRSHQPATVQFGDVLEALLLINRAEFDVYTEAINHILLV